MPTPPLRILHVEDDPADAELVLRALRRGGLTVAVSRVEDRPGLEEALGESWDAVLVDAHLPELDAGESIALVRARLRDVALLVVSGTVGEETVADLVRRGADDFVPKDRLARLPGALAREMVRAQERAARRAADERAHWLAYHDPLTGLPNRNAMAAFEAAQLAGVAETGFIAVEIREFREINHALGFELGDRVLQELAERARRATPPGCLLARGGGDGFAVLVPEGPATCRQIAQDLLGALANPVEIGGVRLTVAAAAGFAVSPRDGTGVNALRRAAHVAVNASRRSGEALVEFNVTMDTFDPSALALAADLRRAVERGEITLAYQPKVDLASGAFSGAEALARWTHPELGPVPPGRFIPVAERLGDIVPLTRSLVRRALSESRSWLSTHPGTRVAVNLSARLLGRADLVEHLDAALAQAEMPPSCLELEVTESEIMQDPAHAIAVLGELAARGIAVSIDDFGTGYSSLGYLVSLPVSAVKIDQRFVRALPAGRKEALVVRATIELGHGLDLAVIAEGVETAAAAQYLRENGADQAQGWHVARPMPPTQLETWIRARDA
ncbi:EAL domain-containing protein [Candidatus Uhrbacteria bacterium]|nr:EAL domain-containing protein [Candidatus Uhrbacteria bacterium]